MAYVFIIVLLLIAGLVAYGYGQALVVSGGIVLALLAVFFVAAAVVGIMEAVKEKAAAAELKQVEAEAAAELKQAEVHRAMAEAKTAVNPNYVLVPTAAVERWAREYPALAEAVIAASTVVTENGKPVTDTELKELRRLAGLDNENGGTR